MSFYEAWGYRGMYNHLRAKHGLDKNLDKIGPLMVQTNTIVASMQHISQALRSSQATALYLRIPRLGHHSKALLSSSDKQGDSRTLSTLRSHSLSVFYLSATSLSEIIQENCVRWLKKIKLLLLNLKPKIYLSSDLWSSANLLSLLGTVTHFLDMEYKHRTVLHGLPPCSATMGDTT